MTREAAPGAMGRVPRADVAGRELELGDLIARAARGDEGALGALYDDTSVLVHSVALRVLRDPVAAEETTLEVFMQVFDTAATFDPARGRASAWLVTLARSRALDRVRADGRRRQHEEPLGLRPEAVEPGRDPEASSAGSELRRTIAAALATLAPGERQAIEIAYFDGLTQSEIAAALGQPLGTVKTRIRTGMMRLREALRPYLGEGQA
ncbi:MAG: sigma-70 family RNA polymerase sigma factor [Candidatus Rokubacteria bacterium]|nr:sigma-70 family RNA polymerase sigma factor [Candidatus Rokubacteria bacterium]